MGNSIQGFSAYQSGKAEKEAYDANADTLRAQSQANLSLAADQMAEMHGQQMRDQSSARAKQGASGLTSTGTGITSEVQIAQQWNRKVNESARSAAQQDINTRSQADMMNYQGELAKQSGKMSLATGLFSDALSFAVMGGIGGFAGGAGAGGGFSWSQAGVAGTKSLFM